VLTISPFPLFHTHYSAESRNEGVLHEHEDDDEERPDSRSAKAAKLSSSSSAATSSIARAADVTAVNRSKRE